MSPLVGKALLAAGILLVLLGAWVLVVGRFPSLPSSWLGRLPGDVFIERKSVRIYLPITTSLLLSLILTLLFWFFSRR
jgi:hypothetical protein